MLRLEIDRELGTEYARFKVAIGLATCIFFYSFSGGERKRVTAQRLAFLREGIPVAIVGDADSSVSMKILPLYRQLTKASRDGIELFDLGIPTVGEKTSLTRRAKDYLKDQEMLLNRISPKVLFGRTFSEDEEHKSVAEVWEAFLKLAELPILEGECVLKNAVVQGVQNGTFGLLIDDKICYAEHALEKENLMLT